MELFLLTSCFAKLLTISHPRIKKSIKIQFPRRAKKINKFSLNEIVHIGTLKFKHFKQLGKLNNIPHQSWHKNAKKIRNSLAYKMRQFLHLCMISDIFKPRHEWRISREGIEIRTGNETFKIPNTLLFNYMTWHFSSMQTAILFDYNNDCQVSHNIFRGFYSCFLVTRYRYFTEKRRRGSERAVNRNMTRKSSFVHFVSTFRPWKLKFLFSWKKTLQLQH